MNNDAPRIGVEKTEFRPAKLMPSDPYWPRDFSQRLESRAPPQLWVMGKLAILETHKIGLFCSVRCPGDVVLVGHEAAKKLRDSGMTVVSGFHSPVEKECLRILLEGKQPIIICLARSLGKIRPPSEWQKALESGRLLMISRFEKSRRADKETARRRNELVAALSDEAFIIHAEEGGGVEKISAMIHHWGIPKIDTLRAP